MSAPFGTVEAVYLGDYCAGRWSRARVLTMADFAQIVADEYGLTVEALRGASSCRPIAHARQDLMARIYASGRYSLPQIGRFLDGRDHTTVLYGIRAHKARQMLTAEGETLAA